jgi:acyl-CoA reductase-like NAD-dependent aldehyde dehydrogenase
MSTNLENEQSLLDQKIEKLQLNKDQWAQKSIQEKINALDHILVQIGKLAQRQVELAVQAKGLPTDEQAEEWLGGPMVQARIARQMKESLVHFSKNQNTGIAPKNAHARADGQVVVDIFPHQFLDKMLFMGFKAQLWLDPKVKLDHFQEDTAVFYRQSQPKGKVALVLAAGNVASIGLLDALHKLFVEGQVCLIKFNPVNEYLYEIFDGVLDELIAQGFVALTKGGADIGEYLCQHPNIDEIHITGSDKTHDAIVYGVGEEGKARKERREPRNLKKISSELGNVSPVIVVPGSWTQKEIQFHAQNIATQLTNNAGFNCNAVRMLILHDEWAQKREFLDALRAVLSKIPTRKAYYPGAFDRFAQFKAAHPNMETFGEQAQGHLPWGFVFDVDPNNENDICFKQEAFCGLAGQTALKAKDAKDFLQKAVEFANHQMWGTLNMTLIIDDRTRKVLQSEVDHAIASLKYGSIVINHWAALSYGMGVTAWGAYPGHEMHDIQSGIGFVHNSFMFESVQKTVIDGPFVVSPLPPWFVTHRRGTQVAKALTALELNPSILALPKVIWHSVLGA